MGDIERCLVLFVSSNPSIADDEVYPRWAAPDSALEHYFVDRFDGGEGQVKDAVYSPKLTGGWRTRPVRYWVAVRARAQELMDCPEPGRDYALTEVVHCKSKGEAGVVSATRVCGPRYLERVIGTAHYAPVIVICGAVARRAANAVLGLQLSAEQRTVELVLGGRPRTLVYLDHPAGFGKGKRFATVLSPDRLQELRRLIATARARGTLEA